MSMTEEFDFDAYLDDAFGNTEPDQDEEKVQAAAEEPEPEEKQAPSEDSESDEKPGDIPYRRFADVARERREYKQKAAELEAKLKALESAEKAPTTSDEDDVDALLKDILGQDYEAGEPGTVDADVRERLAKIEEVHAQRAFEDELAAAQAKFPDIDRKYLIDETIRTGGKIAVLDIAQRAVEDREIVTSSAVADFLDKHPELKDAYRAKYGEGAKAEPKKETPEALPSLKNTASGKKRTPSLEPKADESNEDYLGRLWDAFSS